MENAQTGRSATSAPNGSRSGEPCVIGRDDEVVPDKALVPWFPGLGVVWAQSLIPIDGGGREGCSGLQHGESNVRPLGGEPGTGGTPTVNADPPGRRLRSCAAYLRSLLVMHFRS